MNFKVTFFFKNYSIAGFIFCSTLAGLALFPSACTSGDPNAQVEDSTANADSGQTSNYQDSRNLEIPAPEKRNAPGFYGVIPERFLPPLTAERNQFLTTVDEKRNFVEADYKNGWTTMAKVFYDKDAKRDYFIICNYNCNTPQCKAQYYAFYMNGNKAIDLSEEMFPNITPSVLKEAYQKAGAGKPNGFYFTIDPVKETLQAVTSLNANSAKVLLRFPWRFGRFTWIEE